MAEKFIHINVAAKIPTLADCVKLKAGQSYSATIVQGDDYNVYSIVTGKQIGRAHV